MLKTNMRQYEDRMKRFVKNQLKTLPYASSISEDTLEELTYMVKNEYYEHNQIVFRSGDPTTRVYFVTMGEVDIFQEIGSQELIIDSLYQGCWIGAYKVLSGDKHVFTMRAGSDTTLHYLTKDSLSILMNEYGDFGKEISATRKYIENTNDPLVDFYCYKPIGIEFQGIKYLKLVVVKIIGWIRKINGKLFSVKHTRNQQAWAHDFNKMFNGINDFEHEWESEENKGEL